MSRSIEYVLGGTVFAGPELEPQKLDVRIAGGTIAALEPPGTFTSDDGEALDASGSFVLPGFVDAHDHLRNILPGFAFGSGRGIDDFLLAWWESQRLLGVEEYRAGALLCAVQRLRAGVTTVVDHCYPYHKPGLDEATIEGLTESGIKFGYARGIMTRPYEPISEPWEQAETRLRELVANGAVDPSRLYVAPVSLRQATPDEYRKAVELASELGAGLYTHVAETKSEVADWQEQTGSTPIAALDEIGFLDERTVLVHCVELEDSEIEILASRGSHVVHCPTNHMKLAKGFTRVPDLLEAGVNVAIGIDMMADMLVEIRAELGLHAVHRGTPDVVSIDEALAMATIRGARALGDHMSTGSLDVGKAADLVVVDGRNVDHGPVTDPRYSIAYTAHSGMITHVLVDGVELVADGHCTHIDEEALLGELEQIASDYLQRLESPGLWWQSS